MEDPRYHTFLSHNSADKPVVEELARRLKQEGIVPWLDKWNLIPGNPWQEEIEQALDDCANCVVFIGPSGIGPWQNAEMRAAIDRRISKGNFRVIPVALPGGRRDERSKLPTFLVQTTWVEFRESLAEEDGFHRLIAGIRGIAPGPSPGEAIFEGVCPYRGLQLFDVEHAPFFFGREALTEWLLDELKSKLGKPANRFLAIIGASGSGKSSLARAGLIPALQQGVLEGSQHWPIVILKPGVDPLESLAVKLAKDPSSVATLKKQFSDDASQLHLTARFTLRDEPETQRMVVLVDQFEEIFTLCHDESLRHIFIDNLLYAANEALGQAVVVLTMRADFYGKCASHPTLAAAISDHQILVGPMSDEELHGAIEKPAQLVGCEFEPGLIEILIQDMKDQAGALPLMQYALMQLWDQREGRRLTHTGYEAIGKLEGALEQRANTLFDGLSRDEQTLCQLIFLRLTQPGEGTEDTKRRAARSELGKTETVNAVLQKLIDARLITTEGETQQTESFVEVSHEALIRGWSRLRDWIETDREALRTQHRLSEAANEWQEQDRDESYLYGGVRLDTAEEWSRMHDDVLSELEREFLQTSIERRNRVHKQEEERRQRELKQARWIAVGSIAAAVLLTGLAIFAGYQWRQAEISQIRTLRESSEALLLSNLELDALIRSLNAAKKIRQPLLQLPVFSPTADLKNQVTGTLQKSVHGVKERNRLERHRGRVRSFSFTPEGKLLLATTEQDRSARIRLWTLSGQQVITFKLNGHQGAIKHISISPDGRLVATAGDDETILLWNTSDLQKLEFEGHHTSVRNLSFSPNGKLLASGGQDGTVRLWDSSGNHKFVEFVAHQGPVTQVIFHPDSKMLATIGLEGSGQIAYLWDISGQRVTKFTGHRSNNVTTVIFSPDKLHLATVGLYDTARLWDTAGNLRGHYDKVSYVTFSHDEKQLATASTDGTIHLWDWKNKKQLGDFTGHQGKIWSMRFSPDGVRLATAGKDGTARLWDLESKKQLALLKGHQGGVWEVIFSPSGKLLATKGIAGAVRLWDLEGKQLAEFTGHQKRVSSVVFSPDGKLLATAGFDGTARLWNLEGQQLAEFNRPGGVWSVGFNPDGNLLATAGDGGTVRLWDLEGKQLAEFTGHQKRVSSVIFSPDGKLLATAGFDSTARLWDLEGGQLAELTEHRGRVSSIIFSPDGKQVATTGDDGIARLWDLEGNQLKQIKGRQAPVNRALFGPTGLQLVTAGKDDTFHVWDASGNQVSTFKVPKGWFHQYSFSSDGLRVATIGFDSSVSLWDLDGNQLDQFKVPGATRVIFGPDDKQLAIVKRDNTISLWNVGSKQPAAQFLGHQDTIWTGGFSPNGKLLATGGKDGTARLWDIGGQQLAKFTGFRGEKAHPGTVSSIVFSLDGKQVATAGDDGTARLWNLEGNQLKQIKGRQAPVNRALFGPTGLQLVTAGKDDTFHVWDASGNQVSTFKVPKGWFHQYSFSSDGLRVATIGFDSSVSLWDLDGNQLDQFKVPGATRVIFGPDDKQLAIVERDNSVILWERDSRRIVAHFIGHNSEVLHGSFSSDGKQLATVGADGTARLWDLKGNQLAQFEGDHGKIWGVSFSSDGTLLATAGEDGVAMLWRIEELDELMVRGCDWVRGYLESNANFEGRHLCDGIGTAR